MQTERHICCLALALHSKINLHRTVMFFVEGHKLFYYPIINVENDR